MTRTLTILALAVALGAAPLALSTSAALAAGKHATKVCKHKTAAGKIKTWRCGVDQPCCAAEMLDYYTCGSKLLGCL
jgi:hypothetical protein